MVSITISPRGTNRTSEFSRVDEYAFFVLLGSAAVQATAPLDGDEQEVRWQYLRRGQKTLVRGSRPNQFYPIYVDIQSERIVKIGSPMKTDEPLASVPDVRGAVPVFPIDPDGREKIWGLTPATLRMALGGGYVRVTPGKGPQPYTISYLTTTNIKLVEAGRELRVIGTRPDGSKIVVFSGGKPERRSTVWRDGRHDAGAYGTSILRSLPPRSIISVSEVSLRSRGCPIDFRCRRASGCGSRLLRWLRDHRTCRHAPQSARRWTATMRPCDQQRGVTGRT